MKTNESFFPRKKSVPEKGTLAATVFCHADPLDPLSYFRAAVARKDQLLLRLRWVLLVIWPLPRRRTTPRGTLLPVRGMPVRSMPVLLPVHRLMPGRRLLLPIPTPSHGRMRQEWAGMLDLPKTWKKEVRSLSYAMVPNIYTSSTAQGGGGSFKNRKPIGEIGCCESGMAERSH